MAPEGRLLSQTRQSEVFETPKGVVKRTRSGATATREISLVKSLKDCPLVLGLKDVKGLEMTYPYAKDFDVKVTPENLSEVWKTMIEILYYLELAKVAHLDFRPANLCLHEGVIKVRDFGNGMLLSGTTAYLEAERFPPWQIRGPEFQTPQELVTKDLIRNQNLPSEYEEFYTLALLNVLPGAEFDQRADVWSLACWIFFELEGHYPYQGYKDFGYGHFFTTNDSLSRTMIEGDNGREIEIDYGINLTDKYGLIGTIIGQILMEMDPRQRSWASEIAVQLSMAPIRYSIDLPPLEIKYENLVSATLQETMKGGNEIIYRGEIITNNYLWLLLLAQRSDHPIQDLIFLFAKEKEWTVDEIRIFEELGSQIYTDNLLSAYGLTNRLAYLDLLRKPLSGLPEDLSEQREYLLGLYERFEEQTMGKPGVKLGYDPLD